MAAANAARKSSGPVLRSISPSPRFNRNSPSFASATSTFTRSIPKPQNPITHLYNPISINRPSGSLTFTENQPISPNRSISYKPTPPPPQKRTCMCSPTNHPGSFRCSLHKHQNNNSTQVHNNTSETVSYGNSSRLNMRRSAMKNSLVRIGTVEGDLVKRALAALIRPSSHQQRRRGEFRCRKSRLSVMCISDQ